MAPGRQREPSVDRSEEYDKFIADVGAYHEERGTIFDSEPKIADRHLDLFRLYKRVTEEGGYDVVSDTKEKKLMWRKLAGEFLPHSKALTTQAFLVKSAYYKNLAAYEISTFHKREPPPKEILEDVSAKGGDLLNRTLENYQRPTVSREAEKLANGQDSEGSEEETQDTPKAEDKMEIDEPGSTGRVTRALRQAPPQRVLFQPDISSARQTRHATNAANSPTPGSATMNGATHNSGFSMTIANYEPKPLIPSAVKPVTTPGNNPEYFRNLRNKIILNRKLARGYHQHKGMMLPGTGFTGPNIYIRALLALQSGVPSEVRYALHHLVKISHERGDKYRFDGFPGLAEALLGKVLEVSSLFYAVKWEVSYSDDDSEAGKNTLNGISGTSNLLQKIQSNTPLEFDDDLQPKEWVEQLETVKEAGLILRNMTILHANAHYISKLPLMRDWITIALNLPERASTTEVRLYALEVAEQITQYFSLDAEDPLYLSLVAQLDSNDRGVLTTALRAISRISMNLEAKNALPNIPIRVWQRICDWLLIEDEELRNGCLDLLYQFTAIPENVEVLLNHINIDSLIGQLVRLLMHHATVTEKASSFKSRRQEHYVPQNEDRVPENPPKLSAQLIMQLCGIKDEREQSSQWLRTCFEEDPHFEVTQIQLWSSYNECFNGAPLQKPLMTAKDFITNVSSTFPGATAMVRNDVSGQQPKYTIKGIRPRKVPVDAKGKPYMPCQWRVPLQAQQTNGIQQSDDRSKRVATEKDCGEFTKSSEDLFDHIITSHLGIMKDINGQPKVDPDPDAQRRYSCRWGGCTHFSTSGGESNPALVARHLQTHLPDISALSSVRGRHNRASEGANRSAGAGARPGAGLRENPPSSYTWHNTAIDNKHDAAGLPLASVLVLRNLARQFAKVNKAEQMGDGEGDARGELVRRYFDPVMERLWWVYAHNWALGEYVRSLISAIGGATGWGLPETDDGIMLGA